MTKICVDASLVIKWLVKEEGSPEALKLLQKFRNCNTLLIAPSILDYEIGSVLRQKIIRGLLDHASLYPIIDFYGRLDLQLFHVTDLVLQSVSIAEALQQPTIYDVSYLLIAKQQKTDFVTADKRFYKAASPLFPMVRYYLD
ncbi:MAG: type II toxin-antitoxin system VapC family toxin [Deltaproteobacteria bacterium]|nr:type II toxin-antitoxin system VapC family toxin [Deltaproteobacteria bacterium]